MPSYTLRPYQERAVAALWDYLGREPGNPCIVLPTGCHARGERVLMYDGTTKAAENVRQGDRLMGPDGGPRLVLRLCRGTGDLYRIAPKKGEPFVVNGDHVLHLECAGAVDHIKVSEYIQKDRLWKQPRKLRQADIPPLSRGRLYGFTVEPAGFGAFYGWTLDADHLYLDASFRIHHNSGKSCCIADIASKVVAWEGRLLVLTHVKELIEQLAAHMAEHNPGIWCAGLGRKDLAQITIGSIQSLYRHPPFDAANVPDVVLIDECFVAETPIITERGLVPISEVVVGDRVKNAMGWGAVIATSRRRTTEPLVRLELSDGTVIRCTSSHQFFTSQGWVKAADLEGSDLVGPEGVRLLWEGVPPMAEGGRHGEGSVSPGAEVLGKAAILLDLLLQEAGEPDAEQIGSQAHGTNAEAHKAQTHPSRRERKTPPSTAVSVVALPGNRVACRVASADQGPQGERIPNLLQDRHRKPPNEGGRGDRRIVAYQRGAAGPRPKEDSPSPVVRVEDVSLEQSGRSRLVYNLHVGGHPSYYAAGRLAHNCHLIGRNSDSMYRTLLGHLRELNPNVRLVGLTATPFRLDSGSIVGDGELFDAVCYEARVDHLIRAGYLCPLTAKAATAEVDTIGLAKRGGEFVASAVQELVDDDELIPRTVAEVLERAADRHSILVFCAGVDHAQHVYDELPDPKAIVTGETPADERAHALAEFKAGRIRFMVNVEVLTTGFDAPNIDCIVMLRPTLSPGLYVQMLGRGLRKHPSKEACLVLDFAGNIMRHGPIDVVETPWGRGKGTGDQEAPARTCPDCRTVVATSVKQCPDCGYEWPVERKHSHKADDTAPLSEPVTYDVEHVAYQVHYKEDAPPNHPRTLKVTYHIDPITRISEWVCLEHEGFARRKAEKWWRARSQSDPPDVIEDAVQLAEAGNLREPARITVVKEGRYDRVSDYTWKPGDEPRPLRPYSATHWCDVLGLWLPDIEEELRAAYERRVGLVDREELNAAYDRALAQGCVEVPF